MFRTEEDLCRTLQDVFKRSMRGRNDLRLVSEFDAGNGIADLVVYCVVPDALKFADRLSKIEPRLAVLATGDLPRELSSGQLAKTAGISARTARKLIGQMHQAEVLIKSATPGHVRQIIPLSPVMEWAIAVEVKLNSWRRAMYQASRYKDFADESWVVLDAEQSSSALVHLDIFRRFNIGLATLSDRSELRIAVRPRFQLPRNRARWWAANVQLARRLANGR